MSYRWRCKATSVAPPAWTSLQYKNHPLATLAAAKGKGKGENPTILQFDLITTSNTCSIKYFSTLFIPEQKMLKIITLLKSKSAHLLTRTAPRIKTSSSLHVSLQAHTIPFSHCCLEPVIIHGCGTTEIQVLASLWKLQHLRQANTS